MGSASRSARAVRSRAFPSALIARARYRTWQFLRAFRTHISPDEAREIRSRLSTPELNLFLRMEPADRRHCIDLMHELRADAERDGRCLPAAMVIAALLHDVGKGPLRLWHRVAFVLRGGTSRSLACRIEAEHGAPWRQALWRLRHHAALGATLLHEAGSDERVIEIVAAHTDRSDGADPEIAWFIAADDRV